MSEVCQASLNIYSEENNSLTPHPQRLDMLYDIFHKSLARASRLSLVMRDLRKAGLSHMVTRT